MKRFFYLLPLCGVFALLLTGCNVAKSEIEVDETILSSLPDSVRQDALYRMITFVETANNTNLHVIRSIYSDRFFTPLFISVLIAVSVLLLVFMLLWAHKRNQRMAYENLNRLLAKDASMLPSSEILELLIPYNTAYKRKPYIWDATFVGIGIGVFLLGIFVGEESIGGLGAIIFFYGLMRLLMRLFLDRRERKSNT